MNVKEFREWVGRQIENFQKIYRTFPTQIMINELMKYKLSGITGIDGIDVHKISNCITEDDINGLLGNSNLKVMITEIDDVTRDVIIFKDNNGNQISVVFP